MSGVDCDLVDLPPLDRTRKQPQEVLSSVVGAYH